MAKSDASTSCAQKSRGHHIMRNQSQTIDAINALEFQLSELKQKLGTPIENDQEPVEAEALLIDNLANAVANTCSSLAKQLKRERSVRLPVHRSRSEVTVICRENVSSQLDVVMGRCERLQEELITTGAELGYQQDDKAAARRIEPYVAEAFNHASRLMALLQGFDDEIGKKNYSGFESNARDNLVNANLALDTIRRQLMLVNGEHLVRSSTGVRTFWPVIAHVYNDHLSDAQQFLSAAMRQLDSEVKADNDQEANAMPVEVFDRSIIQKAIDASGRASGVVSMIADDEMAMADRRREDATISLVYAVDDIAAASNALFEVDSYLARIEQEAETA